MLILVLITLYGKIYSMWKTRGRIDWLRARRGGYFSATLGPSACRPQARNAEVLAVADPTSHRTPVIDTPHSL